MPLTQRTRILSPVRSVSWLRFFLGFFLNCKTNIRKFGPHSSTIIHHPNHNSSVYGRRRSLTLAVVHDRRQIYNNHVVGCGRGSSSGKTLGYELEGPGFGGMWIFFTARVQTGPADVYSASYKMSRGAFPGIKTAEHRARHPTSS